VVDELDVGGGWQDGSSIMIQPHQVEETDMVQQDASKSMIEHHASRYSTIVQAQSTVTSPHFLTYSSLSLSPSSTLFLPPPPP
jgi:hypothetical protein